jgi:hypothetical protein
MSMFATGMLNTIANFIKADERKTTCSQTADDLGQLYTDIMTMIVSLRHDRPHFPEYSRMVSQRYYSILDKACSLAPGLNKDVTLIEAVAPIPSAAQQAAIEDLAKRIDAQAKRLSSGLDVSSGPRADRRQSV